MPPVRLQFRLPFVLMFFVAGTTLQLSANAGQASENPPQQGFSHHPHFADYPAEDDFSGKPAPPVLSTSEARRFRTMIRQDAAAGPNFAGHYTIAMWGCGSTCVAFAVVDARTGAVYFHHTVRRAWQIPYQAEGVLQFRRDSRLLIIAGETEGPGGEDGAGKLYYEWNGNHFSLIREDEVRREEGAPPLPPCGSLVEAATELELDRLCAGMQNSYECAQAIERYQLQQPESAGRVQRHGPALRLKLRNGRWLAVRDRLGRADEEASVAHHNFRAYWPEVGYFLVHRQFYEGDDYLLIHEQSGRRHELPALPVLSPDRRRMVAASDGVTGGYSPNVVQIWRLGNTGLELEQTFQPEDWGPSHAAWLDHRTICLARNYPPSGESTPPREHVTLRRRLQWHLEEGAPQKKRPQP